MPWLKQKSLLDSSAQQSGNGLARRRQPHAAEQNNPSKAHSAAGDRPAASAAAGNGSKSVGEALARSLRPSTKPGACGERRSSPSWPTGFRRRPLAGSESPLSASYASLLKSTAAGQVPHRTQSAPRPVRAMCVSTMANCMRSRFSTSATSTRAMLTAASRKSPR